MSPVDRFRPAAVLIVTLALAAGAVGSARQPARSGPDAVSRYRDANAARILREFADLLRFPNRARDTQDIERAAVYIRDQLQSAGAKATPLLLDVSSSDSIRDAASRQSAKVT